MTSHKQDRVRIAVALAVRKKLAKGIAETFPLDAVQVSALQTGGYDVGEPPRTVVAGNGARVLDE
jgi:hypothetical protein